MRNAGLQPDTVTPGLSGLVDRIRAGDAAAFERLFRHCYADLVSYARHFLAHREAAEDVVQDVLVHVWERRQALPDVAALRPYLYQAVRRRAIDYLRHAAVERRTQDRAASHVVHDPAGVLDVVPGPRPTAADSPVLEAELAQAVARAVIALPGRCREAFVLCRDAELSYAQAAEVMGTSPATVKAQMGKALRLLRQSLAPWLLVALLGVLEDTRASRGRAPAEAPGAPPLSILRGG